MFDMRWPFRPPDQPARHAEDGAGGHPDVDADRGRDFLRQLRRRLGQYPEWEWLDVGEGSQAERGPSPALTAYAATALVPQAPAVREGHLGLRDRRVSLLRLTISEPHARPA